MEAVSQNSQPFIPLGAATSPAKTVGDATAVPATANTSFASILRSCGVADHRRRELRRLYRGGSHTRNRSSGSLKKKLSSSSLKNREPSFKKNNNKTKKTVTFAPFAPATIEGRRPSLQETSREDLQHPRAHGLDLLVSVVLQNEFGNLRCQDSKNDGHHQDDTTIHQYSAADSPPRCPHRCPSMEVNIGSGVAGVGENESAGSAPHDTDALVRDDGEWFEYFRALVAYKNSFGDFNCPHGYIDKATGLRLGLWVQGQRQLLSDLHVQQHDTSLGASVLRKVRALKSIGFKSPEEEKAEESLNGGPSGTGTPSLNEWDRGFLKFVVSEASTRYSGNGYRGKKKRKKGNKKTHKASTSSLLDDSERSSSSSASTSKEERQAWIEMQRNHYYPSPQALSAPMETEGSDDKHLNAVDSIDPFLAVQARFRANLLKQFGIDLADKEKQQQQQQQRTTSG